jgi:acyl-coenzyme A synthetase/AMP-(fatty) acid ligase/acyl carrier protein
MLGESRAYRTGDIGMWSDGNELVFKGRRDYQLKIRGQRVEIGEIEGVLGGFSSDLTIVVVACPHPSDSKQKILVAFVNGQGESEGIDGLRFFAQTSLPSHMVPSRFVGVAELPRGATGKVDRRRLQREAVEVLSSPTLHPSSVPSREHEVSSALAQCWTDILQIHEVDAKQSFFEAGGDSISAIKLVIAIHNKYPDSGITVKDVFDFPTIEAMSTRLGLDEQASAGDVVDDVAVDGEHHSEIVSTEDVPSPGLQKLRNVWQEVLKVESINDDSSFFEMGGDSISAIRLVSGVRAALPDSGLTVKDVFDHPTIKDMVRLLPLRATEEYDAGSGTRAKARHVTTKESSDDYTHVVTCRHKAFMSGSLEPLENVEALASPINMWQEVQLPAVDVTISTDERRRLAELFNSTWTALRSDEVIGWVVDDEAVSQVQLNDIVAGGLVVMIIDSADVVSSTFLNTTRLDPGVAEALVSDLLGQVRGLPDSFVASTTHRAHVPILPRRSISWTSKEFWRKVTESASSATVVTDLMIANSKSISSTEEGSAYSSFHLSLPRLLAGASHTTVPSWLVSSTLLCAAQCEADLAKEGTRSSTSSNAFSILVDLPAEAGGINQVPLCVDASPLLVARTHFLVERALGKREYDQPLFEQLVYVERDFKTMAHFEDILQRGIAVCVARISDERLAMKRRNEISFYFDVDGVLSIAPAGKAGACLGALATLSMTANFITSPRRTLDQAPLLPFPVDLSIDSPLGRRLEGLPIADAWPLAPMQEGMLFEWLKDGGGSDSGSTMYVSQQTRYTTINCDTNAMSVSHPPNSGASAIREVWQVLTNEHEALRSCFLWDDVYAPIQCVLSCHSLAYSHAVCSVSSNVQAHDGRPGHNGALLSSIVDGLRASCEEERAAIDLATVAPPFRLRCVSFDTEVGVVVTTTWHHILLGGWSVGLLTNMANQLIRAISNGSAPLLSEQSPSLRSFYAWMSHQERYAAKAEVDELFNNYTEVRYPWDDVVGAAKAELRRTSIVVLTSTARSRAIQTLASSEDVTVASVLRELSASCLMHLSGMTDVVFGQVSSGRSAAAAEVGGIEGMVGMFVNTVGCRALKVNGRVSVRSLAADWVPLASLPQEAASHASRLLHVVQNASVEESVAGDRWVALGGTGELTQDFGLTWTLGSEIGVISSGYASVILSSLLSSIERVGTPGDYTVDVPRSIPSHGEGVTLESESGRLQTHSENTVSIVDEQFHVSRRTFESHTRACSSMSSVSLIVGVYMSRSIESVATAVALLSMGMTYIPIGRSLPRNRVMTMIEDAGIGLVVGSTAKLGDVGAPTVEPVSGIVESSNSLHSAFANTSSYVLYTSGSTGKPKGVRVGSSSLCSQIRWLCDLVAARPTTVTAHRTSLSFDPSLMEICEHTFSGSKLVIVPDELVMDGGGFLWTNASQCVTNFVITPSLLRAVVPIDYFAMQVLDTVTTGAEALDLALVQSFADATPCTELHNLYGPTETTIQVASTRIHPGMVSPPIGHAVYNTKLDVYHGELLIGGVQVGHGYVNLPGKTASSYVAAENDRVYLSGDLVRQDATTSLHYLRRKGMQLKVRGFRVELGEIESVGKAVENVVDFAVVGVPDASGRVEGLVGFYVKKEGVTSDDMQRLLEESLSASLPTYMVPQRYVKLDTIPRNLSMKVDRKQLLALTALPVGVLRQSGESRGTPDTPQQIHLSPLCERMGRIWNRVLRSEGVSHAAGTTFFDAGGDSVSAIRLVNAIRSAYPGVRLTVKDVFDHPTLLKMTERVTQLQGIELYDTVEVVSFADSMTEEGDPATDGLHDEPGCLLMVRQTTSSDVLVCFPGLGWLGGEFEHLSNLLDEFSVHIAQLRDCSLSLNEVVGMICGEIQRMQCERVVLVGHSMGGLVAMKVRSLLDMQSRGRVSLVMIDTYAHSKSTPPISESDIRVAWRRIVGYASSGHWRAKEQFIANARAMSKWDAKGDLGYTVDCDAIIRAGQRAADVYEKNPERTFVVEAADHFSILRMPYVASVASVIRMIRDERE